MTTNPTLLATPVPFIDESPMSWILRICALHACSVSWMRRHFGLPPMCDFDLDLGEEDWSRVLQETGFTSDWLPSIDYTRALKSVGAWENYCARYRSEPYRWCPTCFFFDKVPYYRRSWRFGTWHCTVHGCLLRACCPSCGERPEPSQTSRRVILSLAYCQYCGNALAANAEVDESRAGLQEYLGRYVDEMRGEFRQRIRAIKGEEPLASRYLHPWLVLPRARKRSSSLALAAKQFANPSWSLPGSRRWSGGFDRGSRGRTRLAAALVLFRRELRAMKSAGEPSNFEDDGFGDESSR